MAIESQMVIKEIVSLRCKDLTTGRNRVFTPEQFEDPLHWERIVEEAENNPKGFEIHRTEVVTEREQNEDMSKITLKQLYSMSREKVADVAVFYGFKDEGQRRNVLIDLIAPAMEAAKKSAASHGLGDED